MKLQISLLFSALLATSSPLPAQWVQANAPWDAAVYGFLQHQGILYDHESRPPTIWRSTDNGFNWVKSDTGIGALDDIRALGHAGTILFAANRFGGIYRSTNNGSLWIPVDFFAFVQSFGNLCSCAFAGTNAGVWRSTDGGVIWTLASNSTLPSVGVFALRSHGTTLYAGTGSGIFRSVDAGVNWTALPGSPPVGGSNFWATEGERFAVLHSGLHVSTDAGATWSVNDSVSANAVALCGENVFICGPGPVVRCSEDNGQTWTDVSANLPDFHWQPYGEPYASSLLIYNGEVILGTVYTSIYLRPVAEMIEPPLAVQLADLCFRNGALEWMTLSEIDNYGFYVQNRPAGSGAFEDIPGAFVPGSGTSAVPHSYAYRITGTGGYFRLRQVDLDGINHFTSEILVEADQLTAMSGAGPGNITFSLLQNYPNPFNPTTTIQFTIVNRQWTIVRVYDVLGREVATLVNEVKQPGTYTVQWDATGVSDGIYFYRMNAGDYCAARKMVLLK